MCLQWCEAFKIAFEIVMNVMCRNWRSNIELELFIVNNVRRISAKFPPSTTSTVELSTKPHMTKHNQPQVNRARNHRIKCRAYREVFLFRHQTTSRVSNSVERECHRCSSRVDLMSNWKLSWSRQLFSVAMAAPTTSQEPLAVTCCLAETRDYKNSAMQMRLDNEGNGNGEANRLKRAAKRFKSVSSCPPPQTKAKFIVSISKWSSVPLKRSSFMQDAYRFVVSMCQSVFQHFFQFCIKVWADNLMEIHIRW